MSRPRAPKSKQTFDHCKIFRFDLPNGEFYIGATKVAQLNRIIPNFKKALQDLSNQDDLYVKMRENNWFFEQVEFKVVEEFSCKAHIHFNNKLNEKINELKPHYYNQSQKGPVVRQFEESEKNKFLKELFPEGDINKEQDSDDEEEDTKSSEFLSDNEITNCYDDIFDGKMDIFNGGCAPQAPQYEEVRKEPGFLSENIVKLELEIKKLKGKMQYYCDECEKYVLNTNKKHIESKIHLKAAEKKNLKKI